ncbi:Zn-dependent protease [Lysinibacillus sp. 2017]|nr:MULTISPECIES: DUF2268 domain-containing putative Zn-dependent protease [unclassified Lysinibacillus]AWE09274.1 Zn-dependent protease [Lysinibacillus sp. 2017]TGN36876.1 Zn-dependent protease [Lysinibacillus sp. S2017]
MLTSCTQTENSEKEQNTDDSKIMYTFENPQTSQKYKIIHVNSLFERYFEKVKDTPSESKLELYKKEVIQPVYSDCFENGEFIHMADSTLNKAPTSLTELKVVSDLIETRKDELNALIQDALLKSAQLLPSERDVAVCVFPSSNSKVWMYNVGAGKIVIPYNEYFDDDFIKISVAHEYHHSVWAEKYLSNHSVSVLDNLIFEGKAVMFGKTVYPDIDYTSIDLTYNKELWSKIEPDLNKKDLNRSLEIITGGNDLPLFYGYSEGYKMIKSFLDLNPNQSPEEWTALSTQEIIEKGKYFENYK